MKKITLLILSLLAFHFGQSQNDCASALPVSAGTTTVSGYDGALPNPECAENAGVDPREFGEWYVYTAAIDGVVTITSDLPANAGGDTRLHVYSGTCVALTCEGGSDDVDFGTNNFLSTVTLAVSVGETFYIAWDNQWSDAAFDFLITETAVSCNFSVPFDETYDDNNSFLVCFTTEDNDGDTISWISQQDLDLDGDMLPETFATNGNSATGPKDDWLFSPALALTGGTEYTITSIFNTFSGNGSLEAFLTNAPNSGASVQLPLFSNTNIVPMGDFATLETMAYQEVNAVTPPTSGDWYVAYHSFGPGMSGFILLFDTDLESTLSVEEFEQNSFTYFYNKDTKTLNLQSSTHVFDTIELYNILGQTVIQERLSESTESIDMKSLKDGIYLAKVSIQGQSKTFKILKN
ncbi:T9SS type A sorting domain-containing protein [Psychroserpens sp.]|uniref:T9SS type A sorting domain-containing protein n=1 Tax=Psychroserpens sp. TaxID=2020870 RepID=UPI001B196105|nr:T9SS type A sorting domain-containing protein [Psychroserpens sp.]MBO6607954.1 T9SS type A sorting domain-containing protein [Psychroserpens sp.]MBO6631036.1 T9SS type A sorting domain-containing protein [Psychroserpens sp.]MBO6654919.1 T9SS type A sorting domain-containing protein [Psychroserpens sp.]MBO6683007.1 T9SS type A sorting domain-containing protein [Psychroserpens sp.]MBO6751312.1 T9SS type A sorting domain-containing protein [Psychroserpens sp.]